MANIQLEYRDWETTELPAIPPANLDAVREEAQRVLSDPLFHNSKRYSDLLKYIVDKTLSGQHDCLKERIIGIEVFDRPPNYDTSLDSIVRVAAAEVRKRLARYYHESRQHHEFRIELPTRSYVAEFKRHEQALRTPVAASVAVEIPVPPQPAMAEIQQIPDEAPATSDRLRHWRSYGWGVFAICILALALPAIQRAFFPTSPVDRFWAPMLKNSGPVLISIGSPLPEKPRSAPQPEPHVSPSSTITLEDFIVQQPNFPLADLGTANEINAFLFRRGKQSAIRLAWSTTLSDLHGNPVVVLGSFPNEWAVRLGTNLPFQFRHGADVDWIEDTNNPADKQWLLNVRAPYDQVTSEYVLITRVFDRDTGQWWIGMGGLTVLGTLAAPQIMLDPKALTALTVSLPKDWDTKNLQMVIEIKMIKGSPGASRLAATRSW